MVKIGQLIPSIGFAPPDDTPLPGLEVLTLAELATRAAATDLVTPQRPQFHQLFAVTSGTLRHTVDFTAYGIDAGSVLWVRPGQVQQFGDLTEADGLLAVFQASSVDPRTAAAARLDDPFGRAVAPASDSGTPALHRAITHLAAEFEDAGGLPVAARREVLRNLLAVVAVRAAALCAQPVDTVDTTFVRFRTQLEQDFTHTRRVADYADSLGYSARTLSRATQAAAGVGAKEFIDRRVTLEARRLLAHADLPATAIATRLGFVDATNFAKFFRHRTGLPPGAFRASVR
ncbi:transcriptional regulator [Rhodococcoides trifolii]|uniref:Transcriptional regulator n=2 Tax=Rhodococcoides trifolii TaxID=908250 RepID=A0A917G798_9NOCA|nr:transcriptional regulator [Rhodococcus trifolii]